MDDPQRVADDSRTSGADSLLGADDLLRGVDDLRWAADDPRRGEFARGGGCFQSVYSVIDMSFSICLLNRSIAAAFSR